MKAFVEITSGVVRAGEDCDGYGKDFEKAVAFASADGKHAVIKALVSDGDLSAAHAKAAFRALRQLNLIPVWERFKDTDISPPGWWKRLLLWLLARTA